MRAVDVIERKRDDNELSADEIRFLINGYVAGDIPDYQMSAWCMAVLWRGMSDGENHVFTQAMIDSGECIDLSRISRPTVDKHSTGGVGDKITFIVAPVVAHLGAAVPMLSGRGLGHTGGTLDKLESVPGFRAELTVDEFIDVTEKTGMAITSTTDRIVPADKLIYALRDASGTVPSLPLIVASIMSKKLAVKNKALVLDIKVGEGGLFREPTTARAFAQRAAALGGNFGRDVRYLLTSMNQPHGRAIGNHLEIDEALQTLRGEGPEDLVTVCVAIGAQMVSAAGIAEGERAEDLFRQTLSDGAAEETFTTWIAAQGGDMHAFANAPPASRRIPITATRGGYVHTVHALALGRLAMQLGAGRERKDDTIDFAAGITLDVTQGDEVRAGDTVATLHTNKTADDGPWIAALREAVAIGDESMAAEPLVLDVNGAALAAV